MTGRAVARIDEARCIGCTLCILACPVDAIVGAAKWMHTVIEDSCTGCALCVPPCPVDCIAMLPPETQAPWTQAMAEAASARSGFRALRLARDATERGERLARTAHGTPAQPDEKARIVLAAIERAKARRAGIAPASAGRFPPQAPADGDADGARRAAGEEP